MGDRRGAQASGADPSSYSHSSTLQVILRFLCEIFHVSGFPRVGKDSSSVGPYYVDFASYEMVNPILLVGV
jgi:hypothetical protein